MSLVKHSWRVEKRQSHSWRVADEYDVKKSHGQGACLSSRCHFFLFCFEAYHEELNVHENCCSLLWQLTRTSSQKSIEKCGVGKRLNLRMCVSIRLNKTRTLSVEWPTIPFFCKDTSTAIGMIKNKKDWFAKEKRQTIKSPRKSNPPKCLWGCFEGVFVPDLTWSGDRLGVKGLGLVWPWTSSPTRSDRDQPQTRSRTHHRNLTRLVSNVLLTSLIPPGPKSRHATQATCLPNHSPSREWLDITIRSRGPAAVSNRSWYRLSGQMRGYFLVQARQSSSWSWQFLSRTMSN